MVNWKGSPNFIRGLYLWYDYFSCPQLEHQTAHGRVSVGNLQKAIDSNLERCACCMSSGAAPPKDQSVPNFFFIFLGLIPALVDNSRSRETTARPVCISMPHATSPSLQADLSPTLADLSEPLSPRGIPVYVSRCDHFIALCPVLPSTDGSRMFSDYTWASRGGRWIEREMVNHENAIFHRW